MKSNDHLAAGSTRWMLANAKFGSSFGQELALHIQKPSR